jgi:hypothetical protein
VKRFGLVLVSALVCLPALASDEQTITVTSSSIVKGGVLVKATLQGKPAELSCFTSAPYCSEPSPGEYSLLRASTASDLVYNDCTDVVLYKSTDVGKEKVGVYCWDTSGECYMFSCSPVQVEMFPLPMQRIAPTLPIPEAVPPLYRNPFRFSYPRSAQTGTISGIGYMKLPSGKERIEVKLLADTGWLYVCSAPSANYLRNLKRGDQVSIHPGDAHADVDSGDHRFRLKIIDVDRWAKL